MSRIGLGIITYSRPSFCEKSVKAIVKHCAPVVDHIVLYNDGSDTKHKGAYKRVYQPLAKVGALVLDCPVNYGVSHAKNRCIEELLKSGCDWIILAEDDIKPLSSKAVTGYIEVAEKRGFQTLSFAHHGPANSGGAVEVDDDVSFFMHSVGAWELYSRECLETVGLFDENFHQAWEHVEHTIRIMNAGFAPNAEVHRFPDATDSSKWLQELPNSIEKSSIRPRPDWQDNIKNGLVYWRDEKPETFNQLFGPEMPLYAYAGSILGEQPP